MKEIALIKLAQDGNEEALKMLYEENKNKMFALAFQYVKNAEDAEDILQDTFIKAYQNIDSFRFHEGVNFSSWLYRINVNCCIDHIRKNKIKKEKNKHVDDIETVPSTDGKTDPEHAAQQKAIRTKIDSYLGTLPPKQRMIFTLKHYQQLTTKEIAEYLKCTEGSVKKQLFRAVSGLKKHLRKFFSENNYEMQKKYS